MAGSQARSGSTPDVLPAPCSASKQGGAQKKGDGRCEMDRGTNLRDSQTPKVAQFEQQINSMALEYNPKYKINAHNPVLT